MDVDDRAEVAREVARRAYRPVGHREARMQADHPAHQRRGLNAPAFVEAAPRLLAAEIALGRAVAQERAHAELLADVGENRERAFDQVGRFVVVDQRGGAGEEGAGDIIHRTGTQCLGIEHAVEPPPYPFEDLDEIFRLRRGRRHAVAGEAAVEMRVRAHRPGGDLAVATGDDARAVLRRRRDQPVDDRDAAAVPVGPDQQ